jgi:zinc protease
MLNRKLAPPFQKTISLSLPDPAEIQLSSGIKIFYFEGIKQNIVKVELIFSAGKWAEPSIGLSHFTSMMLEKGTAKKNSAEIAETLDRYGASLEIGPGFDFVSVSLYSLKNKLRNIFPVFLEILTEPAFPEKEWIQMRDIFLQNLKINNEKTSYLASKIIRQNVFGETHPYGSSLEEANVNLIQPDKLITFFKSAFHVHSVYIVGDLPDSEIEFLRDGLNRLTPEKKSVHSIPPPTVQPFSKQVTLDGRLQSSVRLAKRSILKTHAEYPDVLIVTHLLGGFFGSRLMKNIREEKGLTYGISSSLNTFKNDSLFIIGADVNKENVSIVIAEVKKELRKLFTVRVPDQELNLARNHFIGSLQTDMANPFSVEEKIKNINLNELPRNFYQNLLNRIDQITPEEILIAAQKYLDDKTLFEVVVG